MGDTNRDTLFAGSVPEIYERYMVPLIFEGYAADLAVRLRPRQPRRILEIAAGTGVVTRAMAAALEADLVATDLNQAMIDRAQAVGTSRPVAWRQADAQALPFADGEFDAVVCQFGVMFFPDKPRAFAEARRVLQPGGLLAFNVWDRIEDNELTQEITLALAAVFPDDPPRFMARTPHGYCDPEVIRRDLAAGGFSAPPSITTVPLPCRAPSTRVPAVAFCQGTPLRNEIEARAPARLAEITDTVEAALTRRFGPGPIDTRIQAKVVLVDR
jgi:SAM-dependent methyltransferase